MTLRSLKLCANYPKSRQAVQNLHTTKKRESEKPKEKRMLLEGVEKYGAGNWAEILVHYDFNFRTSGNLKDLYRTLTKAKKGDSLWGSPRRITSLAYSKENQAFA